MKVGLTYWSGEVDPLIEKFIYNNSKFFDKFFLISTSKFYYLPRNVKQLHISDEELQKEFLGVVIPDITPGSISDIPCHFARKILKYKYEAVMYTDINTIFTNEFLINQIFECSKPNIYLVKKCEGFRFTNNYSSYVSADWCLDTKDKTCDERLKESLLNKIKNEFHYTSLGPSYLNETRMLLPSCIVISESLWIDDIPYGEIVPGIRKFEVGKRSMGIGFSNSFLRLSNLEATDFIRNGNQVYIKFENR